MATQARKNINQELKKTIFNSIIFSCFVILGSLIKIILNIVFVFENNEDCVDFILILWFSLMVFHDMIYILYTLIYIVLSKIYSNRRRNQPFSDTTNNLSDSLELNILSHINNEENFGNSKVESSTNEFALELKIDKENYWFRWLRIAILW